MLIKSDIFHFLLLSLFICSINSTDYPIYYSSCTNESSTRVCPQDGNVTQYLLNIKKGGTNVLSTADYDQQFFECQEYTFDCGYIQNEKQGISIANGIQLEMNTTQIDAILPANPTLATNIKHYLDLPAEQAKCGMKIFPLTLTATQSDQFFTGYMKKLINNVKTKYALQKKNSSKTWADLNINIKTALSMVFKQDNTLLSSNPIFWQMFVENDFRNMSLYLKNEYQKNNQLEYLHSAYLMDSVTAKCNKYQSVNFLVDQSGSIGASNFQLALDFLTSYINQTQDDTNLISIHFYDTSFQPYLGYGKTKAQLLSGIASKLYRSGGTNTGIAINQTIKLIDAANFDKGINKVLVVITDGYSYDDVLRASNYARSKDITMISVGVGSNVNNAQLLQMAQTPSNIIKASDYSQVPKMVEFISNFFCKQIINLRLNETIENNVVRVPESPAYFRVQKSNTSQFYELTISYETDPQKSGQVLYSSEYDPFPDQFTEFQIPQLYRTSITKKIYYISPSKTVPIRVKKTLYENQTIGSSFVSVGGTNMKFNISLSPCATINCTVQRSKYQQYGKKKDIKPSDDKSYDIYAILAGSIAGLACLAIMGIFALRKIFGGQQQELNQLDHLKPQMTQADINDNLNQNQNKSMSGGSHKQNKRKRKGSKNQRKNSKDKNNKGNSQQDQKYKGGKRSEKSQEQVFD